MARLYRCDVNTRLAYAYQYQEAFKILVEKHRGGSHLLLPALFMLRQYLELILKEKIEYLSQFSNSKSMLNKLNSEHKLTSLSGAFIEHYQKSKNTLNLNSNDTKYIESFKSLSGFFEKLDDYSYTFRYPTNKNGEATFDEEYIEITFIEDYKKANTLLEHLTDFFLITDIATPQTNKSTQETKQ